jgi:hypothetical protein
MLPQLLTLLPTVLDKLIPDKSAQDAAKVKLVEMQMAGELQQIMGQLAINQEEAKNASIWVSGARPFILWTCGVAFAYAAIIEPLLRFIAQVWGGYTGPFPAIDTNLTMQVLMGMLGLGAMRSWDKKNGVAS